MLEEKDALIEELRTRLEQSELSKEEPQANDLNIATDEAKANKNLHLVSFGPTPKGSQFKCEDSLQISAEKRKSAATVTASEKQEASAEKQLDQIDVSLQADFNPIKFTEKYSLGSLQRLSDFSSLGMIDVILGDTLPQPRQPAEQTPAKAEPGSNPQHKPAGTRNGKALSSKKQMPPSSGLANKSSSQSQLHRAKGAGMEKCSSTML